MVCLYYTCSKCQLKYRMRTSGQTFRTYFTRFEIGKQSPKRNENNIFSCISYRKIDFEAHVRSFVLNVSHVGTQCAQPKTCDQKYYFYTINYLESGLANMCATRVYFNSIFPKRKPGVKNIPPPFRLISATSLDRAYSRISRRVKNRLSTNCLGILVERVSQSGVRNSESLSRRKTF